MIRWRSWHCWSALCLLACMYLAVAVALDRDAHAALEIGLIPVTIPEMLRMLRGTVIPPPRRDHAHRQHWSRWRRRHQYEPAKPIGAGMPTQMPHRDYNELQLPYLNAYFRQPFGHRSQLIACDDSAAAHSTDDTLTELIADRPDARTYRVGKATGTAAGVRDTRLDTRSSARAAEPSALRAISGSACRGTTSPSPLRRLVGCPVFMHGCAVTRGW